MPFGAEIVNGLVRFALWAPAARTVEVEISHVPGNAEGGEAHRRLALDGPAQGWFLLCTPHARAGSRYLYILDGTDRVPDPASRFQPDGVHGPSEVVDPASFDWSPPPRRRAWHELVFYELHIGTFTREGTFASAIERLDDIAAFGFTAIELMPVAQTPGRRGWGYDGTYPFAPHAAYGPPSELKALIEAAHSRGLSVFLDVVYNHFGPEGNFLARYAPQFFLEQTSTPWGPALNFEGAREVREFFAHNALYWIEEFGFDGLRLDAVHAICDGSRPDFLTELAARLESAGATTVDGRAYAVLENDHNSARLLRSFAAQWDDDVHHAVHVLVTGERDGYYADYRLSPAALLARALTEGFAYQGERSPSRGGAPRGEPSAGLSPTSFVTYLQSHDQVGNRPFGERIAHLVEHYKVRAAAAVLLLAPSLPLVFMGEEWAASSPFLFFCDFSPWLAERVRDGRRREFAAFEQFAEESAREQIPDPNDERTFRRSLLCWDERGRAPHLQMLDFYRDALQLRHRVVVPLLAERRLDAAWEAVGGLPTAFCARWDFAGGARLRVRANLGDGRGPVPARARQGIGAPFFAVAAPGEPPAHSDAIGAWSVAWWLER